MTPTRTLVAPLLILLLAIVAAVFPPLPALADVDTGDNSYQQEVGDTQTVEGDGGGTGSQGMSEQEWEALKKKLLKAYKKCVAAAGSEDEEARCDLPPDAFGGATCDGDGCTFLDPEVIARRVIARITMPPSTPVFGPDPDINKITPGKLVVGFPYWLTVPGEGSLTTTETELGLTLRLDSRRVKVVYQMGDGTTVTCAKTQPWPGPRLGVDSRGVPRESPVCGHRFQAKGTFTVTSTVYWEVTWTGAGQSGVVPLSFTDSATFEVVPLRTRVER